MQTQTDVIENDEPKAENPCCQCLGTGKIRCTGCGGSGRSLDSSLIDAECLKCHGTTSITCPECGGVGASPFLQFDHEPSHIVPPDAMSEIEKRAASQ